MVANQLSIGTLVDGRFKITGHRGIGGFATIYEAIDTAGGHKVALKALNMVLPAHKLAPARERFFLEAAAMSAIEHPNVAVLFDYGVIDGRRPYLVMELLEGHDLETELARKGPVDPIRVWNLIMGTLEALAVGHDRGIVHKDLKPGNLFLTGSGSEERLMILDFGLACVRKARRLTMPGFITGTPAYLPPEYIFDNVVTPAFDVYQMGLILVEMLTGRPQITAKTPTSCFKSHLQGDALDIPADLARGRLGDVIRAAVHVDHKQRLANARVLRAALSMVDPRMLGVRRRRQFTPLPDAWRARPDSSM